MANVVACPTDHGLQQLVLGTAPAPERDAYIAHLEQCSDCAKRLRKLPHDDTLIEALRAKETLADPKEKEAISRLVTTLRSAWSQSAPPAANGLVTEALEPRKEETFALDGASEEADDESQLLLPAQGPGEIGRLSHYRVLKVLGAGGMGKVYEAEDTLLQRRVALKVMKASIASNPVARKRFIQEAQTAARIEHDNIVPIYQVGEDHGVPFLAMPLLAGRSLDDMLKKTGRLPALQIVRLGSQIAEGLKAAHDRGLIHRDIKPGNIWIEEKSGKWGVGSGRASGQLALDSGQPEKSGQLAVGSGQPEKTELNGLGRLSNSHSPLPTGSSSPTLRVKILDFGLARSLASDVNLTQSGAIVGTPAYMAPEQAQSHPVDHRCDLFSLGCVLYNMCTGELPFRGNDTMGILMALALHDPTPPHKLNDDIPVELSDLVMKLLQKDPANRVGSADEVIETLTNLEHRLTSKSDATTVVRQAPQLPEPARRSTKPGATTLGQPKKTSRVPMIAVAVLLLVGGSFALYEFVLKTPHGTFVAQIDDQEVEARLKNGELQIFDKEGKLKYFLKAGERSKEMPPGTYRIRVVGADGLTVDVDEFTLKKGDKYIARITMAPDGLAKIDPTAKAEPSTKVEPKVVGQPAVFSPLDKLDAAQIKADEREPNQPKELVAVLGSRHMRHWGRVDSVAVSRDGKTIASGGGDDQTVRLWDAATLREKAVLEKAHPVVGFFPDGKTLVTGRSWGRLRFWDLAGPTPKEIASPKGLDIDIHGPGPGWPVTLARDAAVLAMVGKAKGLQVWDLTTSVPTERLIPLPEDVGEFRRMALAPDGSRLAVALELKAPNPKKLCDVRFWDLTEAAPKEQTESKIASINFRDMAFSTDGKILATALGDGLDLWDVRGKTAKKVMQVAKAGTLFPGFAPDGKTLAFSLQINGGQGLADLTGIERRITPLPVYRGPVAFSGDGKLLASVTDNPNVHVFDLSGAAPVERTAPEEIVQRMVFTPDGKTLFCRDMQKTHIWDLVGGELKKRTSLSRSRGNREGFIDVSSDGLLLASSHHQDEVRFWNLAEKEPVLLAVTNAEIQQNTPMAIVPQSRTVAVASSAIGKIRFLDFDGVDVKEKLAFQGHSKKITQLAFNADGKTLACLAAETNSVQLWDLRGPQPVKRALVQEAPYLLDAMALSRDGKTLATNIQGAPGGPHQCWLWDLTGNVPKRKAVINCGNQKVDQLEFSPDGRTLATRPWQGSVTLWDGASGKKLLELASPGWVNTMTFSPDGRHLAVGNANGTAYIVRLAPAP